MMNEQQLLENIEKQEDLGLFYGKMGIAIYAFCNETDTSGHLNKFFAEKLVSQIYEKIDDKMIINLAYGLTGIGLGLDYLVKQSYVEGNIDVILEEIDNLIFKNAAYFNLNEKHDITGLIELLIYFSFRFENGLKKKEPRCIFENLVIKLINYIYMNRTEEMYFEPLLFSLYYMPPIFISVLAKLHQLGIYTFRIEKILEEMQMSLFTRIPILHANKLTLLYAVTKVYNTTRSKEWLEYARLLRSQLSMDVVLSHEIKNKNVFFMDGIGGIYLLLHLYNKESNEPLEIDYPLFQRKIKSSLIWKKYESDTDFQKEKIGLDGYLGLKLLLNHIQSKIEHS